MKWCRHGLQGDVSLSTAIQSPYNTFVSKQRMLSVLAYGYKTQLLFGRIIFANHANSGLVVVLLKTQYPCGMARFDFVYA